MPSPKIPAKERRRILEIALDAHEGAEEAGIAIPDPFNITTAVSQRLAQAGIGHERIYGYWTGERPAMEFGMIRQMFIRFPQYGGAILDPNADLWNEYEEERHPAIWFPADPDHYGWADTDRITVEPYKQPTQMYLGKGVTVPIPRRRPDVQVHRYRRQA